MQKYPSIPTWATYTEAVQTLERLSADRLDAHAQVERLKRERHAAVEADNDAQAQALRSGAKDPGRKFTDAHAKDLTAAETRVGVLDAAVEQQKAAVEALLADERETAIEGVDATIEAARQAYDAALDAVLVARNDWWTARQVRGWLIDGLPSGRPYKGAGAPAVLVDPRPIRDRTVERPEHNADQALNVFRVEFTEDERREVARYVQVSEYDENSRETTKRFVGVDDQGRDYAGRQVVR